MPPTPLAVKVARRQVNFGCRLSVAVLKDVMAPEGSLHAPRDSVSCLLLACRVRIAVWWRAGTMGRLARRAIRRLPAKKKSTGRSATAGGADQSGEEGSIQRRKPTREGCSQKSGATSRRMPAAGGKP